MLPLISIIIPTYNSEKYIKKCLDSIINQTYNNIETIIVDGGSKDQTQQIAHDYCVNKDKWRLILTKKGVSHQRNVGLDIFQGKYLYFLDSDDTISPNLIEDLYNKMLEDNLDLVTPSICCEYYNKDNLIRSEMLVPKINNHVSKDNFFEHGYDSFLAGPTKLYRRELVENERLDEELSNGEDLLFNYQVVCKKPIKYDVCKSAIYYYRHDISVTNPIAKRLNKSGYLFCNRMVDIIRKTHKHDKNYDDALKILKTHVLLFLKEFLLRKKIIPIRLMKARIYMFKQTKRRFRYYYLFPRLFNLLKRFVKQNNNMNTTLDN